MPCLPFLEIVLLDPIDPLGPLTPPVFFVVVVVVANDHLIPHICHFFYTAKFLENKIYTEKRQFFALNL